MTNGIIAIIKEHVNIPLDIPDPLASAWWEASLHVLLAVPEPTQSTDFVSLLHGDTEKMISCSAGSLKQLTPVSSNFRHLARVRLTKANATCFETLRTAFFEVQLLRQACKKCQFDRNEWFMIHEMALNQITHLIKTITYYNAIMLKLLLYFICMNQEIITPGPFELG